MLEADPVIYMVFREDRDRMVGLVSFVNVDGVREERAYGASELELFVVDAQPIDAHRCAHVFGSVLLRAGATTSAALRTAPR